jgi:hypothetical protein
VTETPAPVTDRFAAARTVADAVLYEGYVLYPYRASAPKNQVRWQFGVLAPRAFSEADGSERWSARTECIVDPGSAPTLTVRVRCLQVERRTVEAAAGPGFVETDALDVGGTPLVPWDEAVERTVDLPPVPLLPPAAAAHDEAFRFPPGETVELVRSADGAVAGRVVRLRAAVDGRVRVTATWADGSGGLVKVTVVVENTSDWSSPTGCSYAGYDRIATPRIVERGVGREGALLRSAVAVHTMLAVYDGAFVSLLDPPPAAADAVAGCVNEGTFPVLIASDVMLSSPIILYDHPAVAPESPGDLYDATEIDEILALRVLTLTDDEKAEARATDPRAAAIIDRCDTMSPEMWQRLHGAVRTLEPAGAAPEPVPTVPWWDPGADSSVDPGTDSLTISGVELARGGAVRLRPSHRADAQDLFLAGLTATVAGVFRDVDGNVHVAVTVDGDPATDALASQGRYLYFHPDEVEPLSGGEVAP